MRKFLVRATQAEKKGAEDLFLPINIIDFILYLSSLELDPENRF
jgi:hypothetical protein